MPRDTGDAIMEGIFVTSCVIPYLAFLICYRLLRQKTSHLYLWAVVVLIIYGFAENLLRYEGLFASKSSTGAIGVFYLPFVGAIGLLIVTGLLRLFLRPTPERS